MKVLKKLLILISLLFIIFFGFLVSITESSTAVEPKGGTFCDEGKDKFCWTSIPYWECRDYGGPRCADPVKPPSQK